MGRGAREESRPGRLGPERGLTACERLLDEHGYEPFRETPTRLRLRNCPFHPLASKAPDLVCGMNQAFLAGCLSGLEVNGVRAVLAPEPGECCVRLVPGDPEDGDGPTREDGDRATREDGTTEGGLTAEEG
jgi:predicted ArsR family transcriptional regulator